VFVTKENVLYSFAAKLSYRILRKPKIKESFLFHPKIEQINTSFVEHVTYVIKSRDILFALWWPLADRSRDSKFDDIKRK
jgi:hypothetical protein